MLKRLSIKRVVIYILIFIVLFFGSLIALNPPTKGAILQPQISAFDGSEIKLYYKLAGHMGFDESRAVAVPVDSTIMAPELPLDPDSDGIRLDFGGEPGKLGLLESVTFKVGRQSAILSGSRLAELVQDGKVEISDMTLTSQGEYAKLVTIGEDPNLVIYRNQFSLLPSRFFRGGILLSLIGSLIMTLVIFRYVHLREIAEMVRNVLGNLRLLLKLSVNDFKVKYAGASFGTVWAFAQPVSTILLFWFVFQVGLRSTPVGDVPFILWLMSGLIPWFFFSEAWSGTTNVYLEYSYLVKKVVFKIDILPLVKLISAWFVHVFFVLFMLIVFAFYGYFPTPRMLGLFYYMGCLIYLALGLGFITASVVVFFRDISPLMGIIMQFGMWLTPILWNTDILEPGLVWIFKLNPMYYVVQGYRYCMLGGAMPASTLSETVYFWMAATGLFMLGISLFHRLKPHFADVL